MIVLFFISSCSQISNAPIDEKLQESVIPEVTEKVPAQTDITEPEPRASLVMLKYEAFSNISANETAAYFLRIIPERHLVKFQPEVIQQNYEFFAYGFLMAYMTDFETAITRPLCGIADCAHDTPECMAWIKSNHANISLFAAKDRLFWISNDYRGAVYIGLEPNVYYMEEEFPFIDVSDLDGANRSRLYTAGKNDRFYDSCLLYDGDNLYFCENLKVLGTHSRTLIAVDIETGNIKGSHFLQATEDDGSLIRVAGIYNNEPLFVHNTYTRNGAAPYSVMAPVDSRVFSVDPSSGLRTDYLSYRYNPDDSRWLSGYIWTGSSFIEEDHENFEFIEIDINGTERVILTMPDDSEFMPQIWELYGSKLLLFYPSPADPYYLDIETGILSEYTLTRRGILGDLWPLQIVADVGTEYLVITGATQNFISGHPAEYYDTVSGWGGSRYTYGMISKEDFWNEVSAYREVILKI